MAKVANPLIGKTSGSVGGVTFSTWKGIGVMKTKPTVVANPRSDAQMAQRNAHSLLVALYRLMVAVLSLGFKEMAIKKSAFNAFMSYNLKNAIDKAAAPVVALIPANFKISQGTISDTVITNPTFEPAMNSVACGFANTASLPGQSLTDKTILAAYNETKDDWAFSVGLTTRADGIAGVDAPESWVTGDSVHIYLGFVSIEGDAASDSKHAVAVEDGD